MTRDLMDLLLAASAGIYSAQMYFERIRLNSYEIAHDKCVHLYVFWTFSLMSA